MLLSRNTTVAAIVSAAVLVPGAALAAPPDPDAVTTYAVIADLPYGADQTSPTAFANLIGAINADPAVSLAVHLGDIKNGGTECSDEYFDQIKTGFDTFADPLVYTPGDNEWTDCHRVTNGQYVPTERLDRIREVFFPTAGTTLGAARTVESQSAPFAENVRWSDSGVVSAAVHIVGSANGAAPWDQLPETPDQTAIREAEVAARTTAAIDWIDAAFDEAERTSAPGVVLFTHGDTFISPDVAFQSIIEKIADRSRAFERPVLLFQGDSHTYLEDQPLVDGNAGYGITDPVPNLTRIVANGTTTDEWLELTIDPSTEQVFSWERIPVDVVPDPEIPEAPMVILLSLSTLAIGALLIRRRSFDAGIA